MQSEEFNEIIRKRIAKSTDVLVKKAGEYADDGDRLHNFRAAAGLTGQSMREALGGMMLKHTVSIYDMIRNADVDYPQEMWDEKLGDHLNYLLLLEAVVADEKRQLAEKAAIDYIREDVEKSSSAFIPNYTKDSEPNATIKQGRYRVFAERDINIPNVYNVVYSDKKTMGSVYAHEIELDFDKTDGETDEICPTFSTFKEFAEVYKMPNCVRPVVGDEAAEVSIAGRYYVFDGMTSTEAAYPRFATLEEFHKKFGERSTIDGSVSNYDVSIAELHNPFRKLVK